MVLVDGWEGLGVVSGSVDWRSLSASGIGLLKRREAAAWARAEEHRVQVERALADT